jgi:uncharacterized protein YcbK (DUF882 family)
MQSISELNPNEYKTNPSVEKNLKILFERLLELQAASELDFVITSGLRSDEKQAELIAQGKTNAVHSKHLAGAAADIYDPDGKLKEFIMGNLRVLETIGLWAEHPDHTNGWVHVQMMPPKSGKRIFIP